MSKHLRIKIFAVLLFFVTAAANLNAQSLANYGAVRTTTVGYNSISSTGQAFSAWRNITNNTQDDNRSEFTDIGFDFWYNGVRYTQFSVSSNGFIDFSTSIDDGGPTADDFGYANTAFTQANAANATRPAIAPFYDDLTAQGGVDPLGSSIKYLLSGSAPNRTLTVEWINMAVYLNTTPSLNFQVKLVETTGQIIIHYGTMNTGTQVFSYSMGMNGPTVSLFPTAAELKMLQTVNGTTFNNTAQNNLSAMPAANSRYIFTPPVPTATAGALSFSGISQTAMTVNWTNWAANEIGYVIYNSTDGINYSFAAQTAANATNQAFTGLTPGTTYYWRVYAVTEGCISAAVNGTQATNAAGNKVSNNSGNWSSAATWTPNGVPTAADNVTIGNGHIVQINANAQCNNLVVGQGTSGQLLYNNGGAGYSFTVNNNVTVNSGATFMIPLNSNATSTLVVKGNVVNNGTLNLSSDANSRVRTTFSKNGSQSVTGTGSVNNFYTIDMSLGSTGSNTLDISVPSFSANTGFLTINRGVFKLTCSNTATLTPFTGAVTLNRGTGLWYNTPSMTHSLTGGVTLGGTITVMSGTLNIGDGTNEDLLSNGGSVSMASGAINIAGKFYSNSINNLCYTTISGGTLTVPSFSSTNTSFAPFTMTGTGSSFNMSGGVIVIPREGGNGGQDLGYVNTVSGSVTGGTLQIGNSLTPVSQTININTTLPVGNLSVGSANATAKLLTNSLSVIGNVTNIGRLTANNLNMSVGGNWLSTGQTFTPGTAQVTFSSNAATTISRTGGETFNHLLFAGTGTKTFSSAISASGNFSINTGSTVDVSASNHSVTIRGNFLNSGSFNARTGLVWFNGTTAQAIGGSSTTDFYDITLGNTAGASLSNAENLRGTLTLTAGVFNTNSQVFTMISTATATARIAEITGTGDISGNVTVQRFAPGGTTGWALWGTPISSALTLNDWDDDIAISCSTCPDGSAGGFLSIYTYSESLPGFYDDYTSYIPLSTINDPIVPGKGYWVYLGDGQFTTNNITVDVTGTVTKFNNTIPLSYTSFGSAADDGWNLIHNPYPSPISWSALKGTTSNIDDAIYAYNADLNGGAGGHATYINGISSPAIGSGGIGNTIPMGQGFYVHSTGATALNASESIKVAGNPTYLKNSNSSNSGPLVRLHLKKANFDDETVLYINPSATNGFDAAYDAFKMRGQDPAAPFIALEKTNQQFQVNGVAPISGTFTMSLKTLTGYSGSYTISAEDVSSFPSGACFNLYDKFTGITTDLKNSNYVFNLSDTTTVARFTLNITVNPLTVNSNVSQPDCQTGTGKIVASGANAGPWNFYWKSNGTLVKTSLNKSIPDTLNGLIYGNVELEMNTVGMCDNSNNSFTVDQQVPANAAFNCSDTIDLDVNSTANFINTSQNSVLYFWTFGDGGTSTSLNPTHYYSEPGNYPVKMISWSPTGCADTAYKVVIAKGNAVGINSAGINTSDLILKNNGNNEFVIEQRFNEEHSVHFILSDASGKVLKNFGTISTSDLHLSVDLRTYPPGIYFMTMSYNNHSSVIKLPVH